MNGRICCAVQNLVSALKKLFVKIDRGTRLAVILNELNVVSVYMKVLSETTDTNLSRP